MKRSLLMLALAALLVLPACKAAGGSVTIKELPHGTGCEFEFSQWSERGKYELPSSRGEILQIEILCDDGDISLSISGKNGSELYTGNHLSTGTFTVTISETDEYIVRIAGKNATGSILVKNLGGQQ